MLSYVKLVLMFVLPISAWADLTIFDVRKNLPMSDSDPVYRDFIINGGSESGLSVGMVLTVQRRIPLYDSYQNRSAGDLQLKVARVKIIHTQKGLAVARLHSEFTREGAPLLEENYIMVGDKLDLGSASSDKKADSGNEKPEPSAARDTSSKTTAQIVVNSVDLSSQGEKKQSQLPQKVDVPILQ
jgi:hypothetical protein